MALALINFKVKANFMINLMINFMDIFSTKKVLKTTIPSNGYTFIIINVIRKCKKIPNKIIIQIDGGNEK